MSATLDTATSYRARSATAARLARRLDARAARSSGRAAAHWRREASEADHLAAVLSSMAQRAARACELADALEAARDHAQRESGWHLLATTWPTARVAHACSTCSGDIPVGETYRSQRYRFDGRLQTEKTCPHCLEGRARGDERGTSVAEGLALHDRGSR